jgi:Ankyrin repeats (3 copies)
LGKTIHAILDNYATHKHPKVRLAGPSSAQIFRRTIKHRLLDTSEIRALDFKGEFRRSAICSVSATIGINRSIFEIPCENSVIGLAEKRPSAFTPTIASGTWTSHSKSGRGVCARTQCHHPMDLRPCSMTLLVSSSHPADAGLQVPLIELLLSFGAALEGRGSRKWGGPLVTALTFGMIDAAKALATYGTRIDLSAAAGLGLVDEASRLLPSADPQARHRALSLAAQHGHTEIVCLLLDAGEDPNRYNIEGHHPHSTPLHQAVLGGHEAVVRLLVECGARLDIRDALWQGTPLGWALYGGGKAKVEMTECLRSLGAQRSRPRRE